MKSLKYLIGSAILSAYLAVTGIANAEEVKKSVPVAVIQGYTADLATYHMPDNACFYIKDSVIGKVERKKKLIMLVCNDGKIPCEGQEKEYDDKTLLKLVEGEAYYISYFGNSGSLNKIYHCIDGKAEGEQLFWDLFVRQPWPSRKLRWVYSNNKIVEEEKWLPDGGAKELYMLYGKDGKVIKHCVWSDEYMGSAEPYKEGRLLHQKGGKDFCDTKNKPDFRKSLSEINN